MQRYQIYHVYFCCEPKESFHCHLCLTGLDVPLKSDVVLMLFFLSSSLLKGGHVLLWYDVVWAADWAQASTGTTPASDSEEALQRHPASAGKSRGGSVLLPPQPADRMLGHQARESEPHRLFTLCIFCPTKCSVQSKPCTLFALLCVK